MKNQELQNVVNNMKNDKIFKELKEEIAKTQEFKSNE